MVEKDVIKLERNLGGIKNMRKVPGAVFIIDPGAEKIAVAEARKLNIPVIAITDTNCDPDGIDYVVPGNDDAIKSITLFTSYFANSIVEGSANKRVDSVDGPKKDVACRTNRLRSFDGVFFLKFGFLMPGDVF